MVTPSSTATRHLIEHEAPPGVSESQHGCCCVRSEQTVEHQSTQKSAPPDGSTMTEVINAWFALRIQTNDEALRGYYVTLWYDGCVAGKQIMRYNHSNEEIREPEKHKQISRFSLHQCKLRNDTWNPVNIALISSLDSTFNSRREALYAQYVNARARAFIEL
jgi:hypothetical protein